MELRDIFLPKLLTLTELCYNTSVSRKEREGLVDGVIEDLSVSLKKAGWKSPEEIASFLASIAEDTIKKARLGYVKLADDQTLPESRPSIVSSFGSYHAGQQDMLKQGWRRVAFTQNKEAEKL